MTCATGFVTLADGREVRVSVRPRRRWFRVRGVELVVEAGDGPPLTGRDWGRLAAWLTALAATELPGYGREDEQP